SLQHQGVILRNHITANFRDLRESSVGSWYYKDRRQIGLTGKWSTDDVQRYRTRRLRQVGVDEVWQRITETAEVRSRDHRVSRDLALDNEVPLMNLRQLEIIVEVLHRPYRRIRSRQQVRIDRKQCAIIRRLTCACSRKICRTGRELPLTAIGADTRVYERVVNGRVDHTAVVESPATANAGLAVT